jgi:hypothetical protein
MKYAIEMDSVAIYIPSFIKIGSGMQKLIGRFTRHKHTDKKMEIV